MQRTPTSAIGMVDCGPMCFQLFVSIVSLSLQPKQTELLGCNEAAAVLQERGVYAAKSVFVSHSSPNQNREWI